MVVSIQIDSRKVDNMITGYRRTIPQAARKGMKMLAQKGVENLRQSALQAGIHPWGQGKEPSLFGGRGIFKTEFSGGYRIHITKHGVALDQMNNHWVALKRTRDIRKWALDKGIAVTAGAGARPRVLIYPFPTTSVFVRRHPFIAKGLTKTVKDVKIVGKEVKKAVNRKGR